jgi:hypothetical protein
MNSLLNVRKSMKMMYSKKSIMTCAFLSMETFISNLNRIPKKAGIFILWSIFPILCINAQVTIGALSEPNKHAVLELKEAGEGRGLLLPSIKLEGLTETTPTFVSNDVPQGLVVYNVGTDGASPLPGGLYYWNGTHWESTSNHWFYMPATTFATDYAKQPTGNVKDLYAVYAAHFTSLATQVIGNTSAPELHTQLPSIPAATDFYYYVVSFDDSVFKNISISDHGVMTYDLWKDGDDSTYINIVFVRKR